MTLYLLRHGMAAPAGRGTPDPARPLTPEGAARIALQGAFLAAAGLRPDRILCSPFVRARQTAERIAAALALPVEEERLLRSGCTFDDALEVLGRQQAEEDVLLVGHQPDLGNIAFGLTGARLPVHPGTLVEIRVDRLRAGGGLLTGLYAPEVAARVGHALGAG